jgi:predicted TIM-barrel fold metal-dependent hydrolase
MSIAFERAYNYGMTVTKINLAYERTLDFENVPVEAARKIFKTLVSGNEDMKLSQKDAKPLQDYMTFQLLALARDHHIPVAIHTGLQAGNGNYIRNSDPSLLSNLFMTFPDVKFVLFHGSYPYGGELSALAKVFRNVYVDMNWTYSISPAYAARYLNEWLETVPANKIMAFGGDQRMVEMTYGSVRVAKEVITGVLTAKVRDHYFSEDEAKKIARMILHDNGMNFYNIH